MAEPQLSNAYLMQVKNGLPLAATAPGPSQLKDLPDPCASALSIPKASSALALFQPCLCFFI